MATSIKRQQEFAQIDLRHSVRSAAHPARFSGVHSIGSRKLTPNQWVGWREDLRLKPVETMDCPITYKRKPVEKKKNRSNNSEI